MKYTIGRCIVLLVLLQPRPLHAISMVYNFRIAQITKERIIEKSMFDNHTVTLLFDQYRKRYNGVTQNFVGGLGSYIRYLKPYYVRIDFAASHIHETMDHVTTFSGTETDDLLFTGGRTFAPSDRAEVTLSGLFGIPTHRLYRLQHIDFGYGLVGLGIQLDGRYKFNQRDTFLWGARYIHFFPRNGLDTQCENHRFTLGNIGDIFLSHAMRWPKHGLEYGYTFRARFGAHICPPLDEIIQKTNYLRSNVYAVYKYKFFIGDLPSRMLFYLSCGHDHKPKVYGNRYILTFWTSWNLSF